MRGRMPQHPRRSKGSSAAGSARFSISIYLYLSITVHSKYTGTGKQQAKLDRNALRTARAAIQRALPPPRRRTTRELVYDTQELSSPCTVARAIGVEIATATTGDPNAVARLL